MKIKIGDSIDQLRVKLPNDVVLPTGFYQLDQALDGGFFRQELIVVGAQTGAGKSLLSAQIYLNIAKQGFKSAYFSLEISHKTITSRLIGQIAGIKPARVMYGFLDPEENKKRYNAEIELKAYEDQLWIYDTAYELDEIKKEIKENGYEFVVVDFIQNIIADQKDEYSNLTRTSLELQKLAKECNCCILVVSQLSNMALRNDLLEYKGSGSIAMVADLGFFLLRDQNDELNKDKMILKLAKNRRGFSNRKFGFSIVGDGALLVPFDLDEK